jgi:hypothetical protein
MPNTREKLIELISMVVVPYFANEIADLLIANGIRLEEKQATSDESKWLSVKDRLPDTAERVLVCKTWNGRVYKPEYGYYQDFPNRKGCWYVLTEFGYYPQREVTHWMPLPQPPKGE